MEKFQKLSSANLVEVVGGKRRTKKNWSWNNFWKNGVAYWKGVRDGFFS